MGVDYGVTASANFANVGPRFLRITDIQDDRVDWDTVPFCQATQGEEDGARLRRGDIVFARTGATTGKSYLLRTCPERAVFASYLIRVRPNPSEVEPRYLGWYFQTPDYWQQIMSSASGTAQPGVNATKLKSLSVPTPAISVQRRIADILDIADAIRRRRREGILLTEELLRSAFLGSFGDPMTNPKRWEVAAFRDVLQLPLRNGLSPASGGAHAARLLTLAAITGDGFTTSAIKDGIFAVEPWPDVRVDQRDFLICRGNGNRAFVGRGAFPPKSDPSVVFPDTMIAARVKPSVMMSAFLETLWDSSLVRQQIEAGARTTNGTFKINQGVVEALRIVLPPLDRQAEFERVALQVRATVTHQQQGLMESERLFSSLSGRAFSGALGAAEASC